MKRATQVNLTEWRISSNFNPRPREEGDPIFKFPIETTITNGGLNYKIDEEIEVDLTRFQFMGQDIVRLVLRSTFYVGFVITLIHVTSKFIKH